MGLSIIDAQRDIILNTIRNVTRDDWKVLVVDPDSRRLMDNVLDEDTILNENITNIEQILERRAKNTDVDAVYFLTPQPHIVESLMADLAKRKYRKAHLIWTSLLSPTLRERIDKTPVAREQIALFRVLNVEFHPRESHLVTFRDPWSFPILYHPGCNHLVRQHLEDLAQKVVGVCVALGEYPVIRYYRPRAPAHEASILCSHLARYVQDELDLYAKYHEDFPPPITRPRGALYVVDRSLDLVAPIVHEFTYQAMVHDLLPIKEGEKVTYHTTVNEGQHDQQKKDVEITEKDKIWVENRHRHMKDTIDKLMADFQRFIKDNPNFTKQSEGGANSLNAIKDMLAGLPQFQELKEAYALHLGMAQESMNRFQQYKLPDLASLEQTLATGLDEEYKKPKGLTDQIVRMLDEDDVIPSDRLRLIALFLLYTNGILPADLEKLLAHAGLDPNERQKILNLGSLGATTTRKLKDSKVAPPPLFPQKPPPATLQDEYALSRFEPVLQSLLGAHAAGVLDSETFPYTKPPLDMGDTQYASATSLRAARPTWAKARSNVSTENRQRVIVFMAGGATYSEARACYDMSRTTGREIFLTTSHMITPNFFLRQVGDLSSHPRTLDIPADRPKPKAPAHLFEPEPQPKAPPAPVQQAPVQNAASRGGVVPTQAMGQMGLDQPRPEGTFKGPTDVRAASSNGPTKLTKDAEKKKKHHFFGRKDK